MQNVANIRINWNEKKQEYRIKEPGFDSADYITYALVYPLTIIDARKKTNIHLLIAEELDRDYFKVGSLKDYIPKSVFDFVFDDLLAKDICHAKAIEIAKKLAKLRDYSGIEDILSSGSNIILPE